MTHITVNGNQRAIMTHDEVVHAVKNKYPLVKEDFFQPMVETYLGRDADKIAYAVAEKFGVEDSDLINIVLWSNDDISDVFGDGLLIIDRLLVDSNGDYVGSENIGYMLY